MTEISNKTASNSFSEERVINILMTGAGAPGAAGILKCLYQYPSFNVLVADANENAVGRYINNDFIQIPKAGDPAFVDTLISICREKNIHVLLPLVTKELIPLAKNKTAFEAAGTKVLVSDAESLEIANDKGRLYTFLQWRGIEVPDFRIIDGALPICVQQFKQAIEDLGYPERPVCFKPVVSNGSRGF
ncbi:MAG: hypothetical protein JSU05_12075, partial [Bacteroidetes bacterium]|nr:hypothetical protein [Bacteroidota bacterium]